MLDLHVIINYYIIIITSEQCALYMCIYRINSIVLTGSPEQCVPSLTTVMHIIICIITSPVAVIYFSVVLCQTAMTKSKSTLRISCWFGGAHSLVKR